MSHTIDIESERGHTHSLDLAELAEALRRRFRGGEPLGYVQGKTLIRDAVMEILGGSSTQAESVVEELEAGRFIRYADDPGQAGGGSGPWIIAPQDSSLPDSDLPDSDLPNSGLPNSGGVS